MGREQSWSYAAINQRVAVGSNKCQDRIIALI